MIDSLAERLQGKTIELEATDKAKEILARTGYDSVYGARPLRRAIQSMVEDKLAEKILDGQINIGDKIILESDENDKLVFTKKTSKVEIKKT